MAAAAFSFSFDPYYRGRWPPQVFGIASAVSGQAGERRQRAEERPPNHAGRSRELDHVIEFTRELQKSRHALCVGLAILGESEQIADHILESGRGFDFDRNLRFLKA